MNKLKQLSVALFLGIASLSGVVGLSAANASPVVAGPCAGQSFILPRWYDGLCQGDTIEAPGGDMKAFIIKIALNIVAILLTVVGYVSLGFIIWGGFKYMISGDNANGVSGAKTTILNAVIGLVLSIMSVAIVNLVGDAIK